MKPGHTKCCTCHAKSSWQTRRSDAPKCNPSQEISARTSDEHVSCTAPATRKCILRRFFPHVVTPANRFSTLLQNPHVLLTSGKVHNPLRLPRKTTSERPKVIRTPLFFYTFDLEMCFASRHNGVHFFIISTSKRAAFFCWELFPVFFWFFSPFFGV